MKIKKLTKLRQQLNKAELPLSKREKRAVSVLNKRETLPLSNNQMDSNTYNQ